MTKTKESQNDGPIKWISNQTISVAFVFVTKIYLERFKKIKKKKNTDILSKPC